MDVNRNAGGVDSSKITYRFDFLGVLELVFRLYSFSQQATTLVGRLAR